MYKNMNNGCNMGCNMGCMNNCPGDQNYCNVVNKCFVEEIPHTINYHTHVVNTCVKKHIYIPKYTQSEETVIVNECCGNQYQSLYDNQMNMNTRF